MKIGLIILGVLAFLVLLACVGLMPAAVELPFTLALGWPIYLARVLPTVRISAPGVASAVACLAAVLFIAHALARWLWRETAPPPADAVRPRWRLRWTLTGTAILLLAFAAGIAATGVAHQSAWLARSEAPIFVNRFGSQDEHDKRRCENNLEQIGYALRAYADAHAGQYPDALAALLSEEVRPHYLVCPAGDMNRYASEGASDHPADGAGYTYYAPGRSTPLPPRTPIASEPITYHMLAGAHILFADGKVEWHTPAEVGKILSTATGAP